jgi:hypothetical protein
MINPTTVFRDVIKTARGEDATKLLNLFRLLINNADLHGVDLYDYITKYTKNGAKVNHSKYELTFHKGRGHSAYWSEDRWSVSQHRFFSDGNYSFFLNSSECRKGLLATIGFDLNKNLELEVTQIQSRRNRKEEDSYEVDPLLRNLKWERMLLHIVTDWASISGFRKIRVNSPYHHIGDRDVRMKIRYKTTPKRNGFKFDPEKKDFYLDLQNHSSGL